MLKNTALKYRMILGGVAAVLIPFLVAGMIVSALLSDSLLEMTQEQSVRMAANVASLIDANLMQEIRLASSIAADPTVVRASRSGDYRHIQAKLEAVHKRIGKPFFTLFVLDRKGRVRADAHFPKQFGVDLSDREYFLRAREGKTTITGPLPARGPSTPGDPIVIVSAPIREDNEFHGVVCIPFDPSFLGAIVSQVRTGKTGYAYLVNSEGLVLAHPKKEHVLRVRLQDYPGTEEIYELAQAGKTGTASYYSGGAWKVAGLTTMQLTGWTVVFAQNRDEVMAPVNRILWIMFVSGILFLIITIATIVVVSSKLSSPVQRLLETMKTMTEHSTEIILQIGADRKITFANPAFERVTGTRPEEVIGTEPDLANPHDIPPEVIWDSLNAGTPWSGRVSLKASDGAPIALDVMVMPLRQPGRAVEGYLEIGRDVTKELLYESRMQQSQKLQAIGTLAGGIAHDFNNILSGILGYAELALITGEHDEEMEKFLREIIKAAQRAGDLVGQILTFSRQTEVELRPILPGPVLEEASKLLRASAPAFIDMRLEIDSRSAILAEPTQIHQIVMNLFTNAVHAIGQAHGTITIELQDFVADEDFTRAHPDMRPGKHVALRVSDTGSGMEPEVVDHIFEPFFTMRSQGKGTGLGLSVVHGIVKKLEGTIEVKSQVGTGTTFSIYIPCTEMDTASPPREVPPIEKGKHRIVLIDDEEAILATTGAILTRLGHTVTAFANGLEALKAIEATPHGFDLIITDHSMPKITGLEIVRSLKEKGISIPVILTSGYLAHTMADQIRDVGVSEVMTKPITVRQLAETIERVLGDPRPVDSETAASSQNT